MSKNLKMLDLIISLINKEELSDDQKQEISSLLSDPANLFYLQDAFQIEKSINETISDLSELYQIEKDINEKINSKQIKKKKTLKTIFYFITPVVIILISTFIWINFKTTKVVPTVNTNDTVLIKPQGSATFSSNDTDKDKFIIFHDTDIIDVSNNNHTLVYRIRTDTIKANVLNYLIDTIAANYIQISFELLKQSSVSIRIKKDSEIIYPFKDSIISDGYHKIIIPCIIINMQGNNFNHIAIETTINSEIYLDFFVIGVRGKPVHMGVPANMKFEQW
ncbi:MAG: hypothetical protein NT007_00525 [Candidatus Kapabacteria bacterium]|nr:hypothetical protein [Candidatus Kapabacteria bacterium]